MDADTSVDADACIWVWAWNQWVTIEMTIELIDQVDLNCVLMSA